MQSAPLSDVIDLLLNLSLLIALTIFSGFIERRVPRIKPAGWVLQGLLFGGAALLGMLKPLVFGPGIIFDGRSVMISLCSLHFGPVAAALSCLPPLAYRIAMGGGGATMGVLVILASACIGLVWRAAFKPDERPPSSLNLYLFGLAVHAAMLALMLTLPDGTGIVALGRVGPPVIILYPFATILAGKILSDQTSSRISLEALKESEERFQLSMEATNDGLWDHSVPSGKSYYNPAYYRILGYEPGDFATTHEAWQALMHPDDRERVVNASDDVVKGVTEQIESEYRLRAKDGSWRWIYARGKCVRRDERGNPLRIVGTHVDITERKEAEARLERSLAEKEVLLREVHHRVKNNLNVISSLLNLQATSITTPEGAIAAFENSRERILAMALVHEELYKSREYSSVDMGRYLEHLGKQLALAYDLANAVRLETKADDVHLDVSASIPCGLIFNELITNAFKYAFPEGRRGTVKAGMAYAPDGDVILEVSDDGIGLPPKYRDASLEEGTSLGMTLVKLLASQLNGTIETRVDGGTRFTVKFPGK